MDISGTIALFKHRYHNEIHTVIFWLHIGVIIFAVSLGFFFSFPDVVFLIMLHRLHIFVFKDCLLSVIQRRLGGFAEELNFLQYAAKRLFRKEITVFQSYLVEGSLIGTCCLLAIGIHLI